MLPCPANGPAESTFCFFTHPFYVVLKDTLRGKNHYYGINVSMLLESNSRNSFQLKAAISLKATYPSVRKSLDVLVNF